MNAHHRVFRGPVIRPFLVIGALIGALVTLIGLVPGRVGAQISAVTNYADYPSPLPAGCPDGPAALLDVRWSNSRGDETSDLRTLPTQPGETITTSWSGFAPGCLNPDGTPAITVSMASYDAVAYPFDPTVNQRLLDGWPSCGADGAPCQQFDGRFTLRLTLPTNDVTCVVQFGTILGPPLAVVGPNGSFYSTVLRGDDRPNMLVGAQNYEIVPCVAPSSTITTAPPATAPASTAAAPTTMSTVPGPGVLAGSVTAPAGALPFTGVDTAPLVIVAASAVIIGLAAVTVSRRRSISDTLDR